MSFMDYVLPVFVEPEINFNFVVMVGIRPFGEFRTVSGAGINHSPLSLVEGGRNHSPHLLVHTAGSVSQWGEVTLQWGTPVWSTLYDWADAVRVGRHFRRDVFVIQLTRSGLPTRLMRFAGAWPKSWKASGLDTSSTEWAAEEITLVYEDFNMVLTRITAVGELIDRISAAVESGSAIDLMGDELAARTRLESDKERGADDLFAPEGEAAGAIPRSVDELGVSSGAGDPEAEPEAEVPASVDLLGSAAGGGEEAGTEEVAPVSPGERVAVLGGPDDGGEA